MRSSQVGKGILGACRRSIAVSEKCYTALARMAAAAGDADEALSVARRMHSTADSPQRLRLYHPALVAYTAAGNIDAAFKAGASTFHE